MPSTRNYANGYNVTVTLPSRVDSGWLAEGTIWYRQDFTGLRVHGQGDDIPAAERDAHRKAAKAISEYLTDFG